MSAAAVELERQAATVTAPAGRGLYLIHLEPRYRHAGHYLGFSRAIADRLEVHRSGGADSSPLLRAATAAGCELELVRVWPDGNRTLERRLKRQGGLSRHCPTCRQSGSFHR